MGAKKAKKDERKNVEKMAKIKGRTTEESSERVIAICGGSGEGET